MPEAYSEQPHSDLDRAEFWSVFDQTQIPIALVDRERRYVKVNDACVELYKTPREEILGSLAGRTVVADDGSASDAKWAELLRTNELYGEDIVTHVNGSRMHVSYAAHATTLNGRWLALIVTLSARVQPDGAELIGTAPIESSNGASSKLTDREREVVRLVALGSTTRQIAADLHLSPDTIRSHVRNSMAKIGAHTRAQLVALVLADGLIEE
jgi:DNA-binding CsgD family transcriptional regulator